MVGYSRSRTGLTLIQLVQLIAATGLLAAFLFAAFSGAHESYRPPTCISHLKQLGLSMMMYEQDYDGCYPSFRSDAKSDWSIPVWSIDRVSVQQFHNCSPWVAQLLPYIKGQDVFHCPQDADPERNHTSAILSGLATPFPVSYGPNLMFVNPAAYGRKQPVATSSVDQPDKKYLLGDCATAYGFDLDTIAYLRYPNYDPPLRQNGWSLDQLTAAGRVACPDEQVERLTRHHLGSNIMFADGRTHWLRHDQIPNNDGPHGKQYRKLKESVVPWQAIPPDPAAPGAKVVGREER